MELLIYTTSSECNAFSTCLTFEDPNSLNTYKKLYVKLPPLGLEPRTDVG